MSIPRFLVHLELLVNQYLKDETMQEDIFFKELAAKLQKICNIAREQNMDSVRLISLLTPFLKFLTKNFGCLLRQRKEVINLMNTAFSSIHLSFSLQTKDEEKVFVVEQTPINISIAESFMYQTTDPTDCMSFLRNIVRDYPGWRTPVIQFWFLSSGIFQDIFGTFGDVLERFYLPPKVPKGHPHPFIFIEEYRAYYKFELFDQIFTILNKSVSELRITSNDFHQILRLLKEAQNNSDDDYPRDRLTTFFFISALIGFQLRDMLSSAEDKRMITEVLRIKENEVLQCNVKAEIKMYYSSRISYDFFRDPKKSAEVDFTYLQHMITDFEDDLAKSMKACNALTKFYDGLLK
jgi:hypothetical protein